MDNTNKTSLEEAKANFQQIKKFATEAAKKEFEIEINEKIDKILKESLSVEVDDDNNITINTDEKVVEVANDGEVEVEDKVEHDEEIETGEEIPDEDDEEINIEKNIDEMMTFEQEQPVGPAPEGAAIPAETPVDNSMETPEEAPAQEAPVNNDVLELAQLLDKIIDKKISGGDSGAEQGVDVNYIDDEAGETSAAPAEPAAQAPAAPVQEDDDLLEFSLEEIEDAGNNDMMEFDIPDGKEDYGTDTMEFDIPDKNDDFEIDYNPTAKKAAVDDMSKEKKNWKKDVPSLNIPKVSYEEELDEMKGQGKVVRNTSNRLGLEPREGTPNLKESVNKIKAQYVSKIDELLKENVSLKESNKEFGEVIKNYRESFKDLRKQFDEMQTFNAKLAYANKIFASGGLSTSEKAMIAEEFDKTQTAEDAKKLYNKILQENKIVINKEGASKIKASITNTIKSKDTVYESVDMKRRKVLAGIEKNEDYL